MTLFIHIGKVKPIDTFAEGIESIKDRLKGTMNQVFPMYKLFHDILQGNIKSF